MSNQFFYKSATVQGKPGIASFDLNRVIRTVEYNEGQLLVLIDDGHEQSIDVPGKKKGEVQRQRQFIQSEILLSKEDSQRLLVYYGASDQGLVTNEILQIHAKNLQDTSVTSSGFLQTDPLPKGDAVLTTN